MAAYQTKRHRLGRTGERIISKLLNCKRTSHKAPFDIVDFQARIAYEVKTMSGLSRDLKIHISDKSMTNKLKFARDYGLEMVLIAVVVYSPKKAKVYQSKLSQSIRINQMEELS